MALEILAGQLVQEILSLNGATLLVAVGVLYGLKQAQAKAV